MRDEQLNARQSSGPSPEDTFASKYAWLLRWALHFVQNDRPAAEDLVQETFVRMLLTWESLKDMHNLEPFLYSHLRYAYLTERRRGRHSSSQSLATMEADALTMSIASDSPFERMDVQDELRSIVSFLLWKRLTTKYASIFLLRFFHGFFPEEIAGICRSTRHSVDLSLRHAREEIKTYLLHPNAQQIREDARLPALIPGAMTPVWEFTDSLRHQILSSRRDACPPLSAIERYYRPDSRRPIACDLLGHVVTCQRCLEQVTGCCGIQVPSSRSIENSLSSAPRLKDRKRSPVDNRIFAASQPLFLSPLQ